MDELKKCAEVLIRKAAEAETAIDALQFSQAACNVANAMTQLQNVHAKVRGTE